MSGSGGGHDLPVVVRRQCLPHADELRTLLDFEVELCEVEAIARFGEDSAKFLLELRQQARKRAISRGCCSAARRTEVISEYRSMTSETFAHESPVGSRLRSARPFKGRDSVSIPPFPDRHPQ